MSDSQGADEHRLIADRRRKLAQLREQGVAFPNDFRRNAQAAELHATYDDSDGEALAERAL